MGDHRPHWGGAQIGEFMHHIAPNHAERALGHVIGGVRGVYDRHGYRDEKRAAFEALAGHIARVVNPQPNVVPIRRAAEIITGT
jgi:hypothetical protein